MATELTKTGIEVIGDVPWGTHFFQFYETEEDLLDILIPYFTAGFENNEYCLWVVWDPQSLKAARELIRTIPEFARHLEYIEIVPYTVLYTKDGTFELERVIVLLEEKLDQAFAKGYAGVRLIGNSGWLAKRDWANFAAYERRLDELIASTRMIGVCTYVLSKMSASDLFDVASVHQFIAARRYGDWAALETSESKQAKAEIMKLNEELEQRVIQRTKELAAANKELREKSLNLEEVNTTLRVLLRNREEDERKLGEAILSNIRTIILPYVEKLKGSRLSSNQTAVVEILESNLSGIISPFTRKLGLQESSLTPTEIRIAAFIRDGRSTTDIAEILNISEKTVFRHRDNIREKLGLTGSRMNLRTYLLSLN